MRSSQQQEGKSEAISTQPGLPETGTKEKRLNSESEDSEEEEGDTGKLPDFVDLNEMGQS
jgi:hypothetical protein